jgi:hypothetical protein
MKPKKEVLELLEGPHICVLATVNPDGSAHAMPMWYLFDEGEILFMTGPTSQKFKNVARTGRATIVVDRRSLPYYAIMVKGDAAVGAPLAPGLQQRLVARYLGEEGARKYLASSGAADAGSIRVKPKKIVEFNGRAGRD